MAHINPSVPKNCIMIFTHPYRLECILKQMFNFADNNPSEKNKIFLKQLNRFVKTKKVDESHQEQNHMRDMGGGGITGYDDYGPIKYSPGSVIKLSDNSLELICSGKPDTSRYHYTSIYTENPRSMKFRNVEFKTSTTNVSDAKPLTPTVVSNIKRIYKLAVDIIFVAELPYISSWVGNDPSITPPEKDLITQIVQSVRDYKVLASFVSDLKRSRETAMEVLSRMNSTLTTIPLTVIPCLHEINNSEGYIKNKNGETLCDGQSLMGSSNKNLPSRNNLSSNSPETTVTINGQFYKSNTTWEWYNKFYDKSRIDKSSKSKKCRDNPVMDKIIEVLNMLSKTASSIPKNITTSPVASSNTAVISSLASPSGIGASQVNNSVPKGASTYEYSPVNTPNSTSPPKYSSPWDRASSSNPAYPRSNAQRVNGGRSRKTKKRNNRTRKYKNKRNNSRKKFFKS